MLLLADMCAYLAEFRRCPPFRDSLMVELHRILHLRRPVTSRPPSCRLEMSASAAVSVSSSALGQCLRKQTVKCFRMDLPDDLAYL